MERRATGAGGIPVQRTEMTTRDMDVIADLISRLYVEHQARFRCPDPARVDAGARAATTGLLEAVVVRYQGFDYHASVSPPDDLVGPPDDFFAPVTLTGTGTLTTAREQVRFTRGDVFLNPTDRPYTADMHDCSFALLRVPRPVADDLAEERTGLPAADLRFESIAPVSASARVLWSHTVAFICRELLSSGITETSPIMAYEMTRLAAAALLETFPNTSMTAAYIPGPGRVPSATVRRAAAFIYDHAGQPVTMPEVAAAAGVTARALQYAFRCHYDTTPTGYLRRVRLERAHRQLQAADPATGATVGEIARRWGWASPANFAAAYRKHFGVSPSHTLRT
jgi:AraC-like DNA-binding protein